MRQAEQWKAQTESAFRLFTEKEKSGQQVTPIRIWQTN